MSKFNCRLCKTEINMPPLLSMSPFPKAAQFYPEIHEFEKDTGITLEIYKCPSCDLMQLACEPVSYYKEVITAASFSNEARQARLVELSNFVKLFGLKGKEVVEVGSGRGGMVDIMNEAGMNACGLEYSKESINLSLSSNYKMIQGYIDDLDNKFDGKFDAFISLNYIEHQPNTKSFIQSLLRVTRPGAVGYITAPNVSYLLETNTLYEFVADHLIYFTEATMRRAFESNGFDVIESSIINNKNDISLTVKKREIQEISGIDDVEKLSEKLKAFVTRNYLNGKKIAVWGAGHRTLALLSIAKISEISFIVDSADFKQGKYSPVMHSKIVSPEELENSDVDIVIVMVPGLYPDEVVKKIRSFSRDFEIYKLQDNRLIEA
jgi:2-polyprenyl-3-methyl-5-hydroxy-6-metoxy-1,4-benzoquinol methylase